MDIVAAITFLALSFVCFFESLTAGSKGQIDVASEATLLAIYFMLGAIFFLLVNIASYLQKIYKTHVNQTGRVEKN